jgi:NADH-quinone oxidoreductase subunit N
VNDAAFSASVLYILIYGVMTLGAFAVVIALSRGSRPLLIADLAGLVRRAPVLAVAMTVFMVSLAGIPPTGGFWAKFVVFRAAIDAGGVGPWLAVVMLVNSVVSLVYYLMIPKQMLLEEGEFADLEAPGRPVRTPALVAGIVVLATIGVLAIGVYPDLIAKFPSMSTLTGG